MNCFPIIAIVSIDNSSITLKKAYIQEYSYKGSMPLDKPFVGIYVMETEDKLLQTLASEHNIAKTKLARALMRAGLQVFKQNPEQVLISADLRAIS